MSEFWKNRDGCEVRGSRSACSLLKTRRYEAPAGFAGRKDTARVTRYPLVMHGSRKSCSLRLDRRKHGVCFVPAGDRGLPMPPVFTCTKGYLGRRLSCCSRQPPRTGQRQSGVVDGLRNRRCKISGGIGKKGARHTQGTGRICRQNGEKLAETGRLTSAATELCTEYGQNVRFLLFPILRVRRLTADRKSYPQARRLSCRYAGMNLYRMNLSTNALENPAPTAKLNYS